MSRLFLYIYDYFEKHRVAFFAILFSLVAVLAVMASQVRFQENITNFFNSSSEEKNSTFENLAVKDKIIVLISGEDPDEIISSAEIFEEQIEVLKQENLVSAVTATADEQTIGSVISFVYKYLPIFLTDEDYKALEEKTTAESIDNQIGNVYNILTSPSGMIIGDVVMGDPLNVGTPLLQKFEKYNPNLDYEIYGGRLFTSDLSTMLMFIQPSNGMGDTGANDRLVSILEEAEAKAEINGVSIDCIGGPIIAVYNARQIKQDTMLTLTLAMVIILLVIYLSFKNKRSIPLIIVPPMFGALFSLAFVWLVKGEISAIAIGVGAIVLGIALSYSIHIVSHLNSKSSPKEIIEELTMPLTIGCFTTIGAFAALIFTPSALLQDMGLFSVFTLIGTTIFSLVFMPQFLRGFESTKKSYLLDKIEQIVGYRYDSNKWVVLSILALFAVALFYYQDVDFDENMSHINFMPEHIVRAEERAAEIFGDESKNVYIATGGKDLDALTAEYTQLETILNAFKADSTIAEVVTLSDFVVPTKVQQSRIEKWNNFWQGKKAQVLAQIDKSAQQNGFKPAAFSRFRDLIEKEYTVCGYSKEEIENIPLISEWLTMTENNTTLLSLISIDAEQKEAVYTEVEKLSHTTVIDRGYFSSKMVETTTDEFNYILLVSSLIVFLTLYISYGRLELTLLTFLPMAISWVIILGLMALLDIKFNIVNVILATFIFGIGDDFSIFTMDGLLQEYKNGKKVFGAHKIAIFFSAFTAIVGMGVLVFAEHPALKSIAFISVLGLSIVVLVSYTVQPMLFRLLVSNQTEKGGFPFTILSILNTLYCFLYFLCGCIFLQVYMIPILVLPLKREQKKYAVHKMIYWIIRFYLYTVNVKTVRENPHGETYKKPALIIANHQSFIDILLMLSTTPKIVMMTKHYVWKSPLFGWIVRYADFFSAGNGYEDLEEKLKERIAEGYSVMIFPEGTRSADLSIQRFHKGAFYLADLLKLDILPMLIYGTGHISSKRQAFYIKHGTMAVRTMPRIKYGDKTFGTTYQEQAKMYRKWYKEQYKMYEAQWSRTTDPYFKEAIIKNYIYKGPTLEWYMRIKCRLDGYYDLWDRLIPRNATITDIGCGYGQMSFMLALLSSERTVLGIDYDSEKIEECNHSFLCKNGNVKFLCADSRTVDIPKSDAILFNDSLHYVDENSQRNILLRSLASLNEGGMILVRDGDASQTEKHEKIKQTEVWSTRIIKFNKTTTELTFVSEKWMRDFAVENHLQIKIHKCDKDSSETLYILTR